MKIYRWLASLLTAFLLTTSFFSQTDSVATKSVATKSDYLISAKAGAVNFVSGDVQLRRNDGKSAILTKDLSVEDGEVVTTAANGRAEILLNPGSYVRLSENSEFELASTSLDDLQLKLVRGGAIFELTADNDFSVLIETPRSAVKIEKTGVYRIDVNEDGSAQLEVWKGKVRLAGEKVITVKAGQKTVIGNDAIVVAKFDRDEKDNFELWSRDRAKELAKINSKLASKMMNRALVAFSQNSGNWNSPFGLWVNDPWSRTYCFLPFSYSWVSPYGQWYDRSFWSYQVASHLANAPANNANWGNNPPPNNSLPNPGANSGQGNIPVNPVFDSSPRQSPAIERNNIDRNDRSVREVAPRVRDQ